MSKFIRMRKFMQALFDDQREATKAAEIGQAMLAAGSLRMTDIAAKMAGSTAASYSVFSGLSTTPIRARCCGVYFKSKPSL